MRVFLDDYMLQKSATTNDSWKLAIQEASDSIELHKISTNALSVGAIMSAIVRGNGQWLADGWDS